jgi:hypothetical protein
MSPIQITVGIVFCVAACACVMWRLHENDKNRGPRALPPEDGHDRAGRREMNWYWNAERNKEAENNPVGDPRR